MTKLEKRSKSACERCRKRKTKCSGEHPCQLCLLLAQECLYARKAKKISVMDVDVEQYQQQIADLQQEVKQLKASLGENVLVDTIPIKEPKPISVGREPLSLLSCASPEVVCWQLQKWIQEGTDLPIKSFSTEYEEKCYDILLTAPINTPANDLSYDEVIRLFNNILFFFNLGYLVVDPEQFKIKCNLYFARKDVGKIFGYNIMMVAALGEIYDVSTNLASPVNLTKVPGLDYFRTVMNNFPSPVDILLVESVEESIEIIELLGLMALYLRILDKKSAAATCTLNAMQISISLNLYKENQHNKIWWSIYCLNRYFTTRIGKPLLVESHQIQTLLPKDDTLRYYVQLAMISERINRELFDRKERDEIHNNNYKLISSLMHDLMNWKNSIPDKLTLKLTSSEEIDNNDRIIYTLHLNYLHHIYLTCIPILIKFSHIQLKHYRKTKEIIPTRKLLTKNWSNLIGKLINSAQLTIKIFSKLYTQNIVRVFGFTDLDYLFSSNLVILIAMILNIDNNCEEYLQLGMNFMNEMKNKGNMVAEGKIDRLMNLILELKEILNILGYSQFVSLLEVKYAEQTSYTPFNFMDYQFINDINDVQFMNENDFSFLEYLDY